MALLVLVCIGSPLLLCSLFYTPAALLNVRCLTPLAPCFHLFQGCIIGRCFHKLQTFSCIVAQNLLPGHMVCSLVFHIVLPPTGCTVGTCSSVLLLFSPHFKLRTLRLAPYFGITLLTSGPAPHRVFALQKELC